MKIGTNEIFYINALNNISGANARDCIIQKNVVSFLVKEEDIGKAIGKQGCNVKKLRGIVKKNIEVLLYCKNIEKFLRKALYNIKVKEIDLIEENGKKSVVVSLDSLNKKKLLQNLGRIKRIKQIAKRNYDINEIKIR